MTNLDRRVALALGGTHDKYGRWTIDGFLHHELPHIVTPSWVGFILLEAAKRGWMVSIINLDESEDPYWSVTIKGKEVEAASLPEAVCRAFCEATQGAAS